MIKTAMFDLGNVLLKVCPDHTLQRIIPYIKKKSISSLDASLFQSELTAAYETGRISDEEFYIKIRDMLQADFSFQVFKVAWCAMFEPIEKTISLLPQFFAAYQTLLLSNTNALHIDYCVQQYKWMHHFDDKILSFEVNSAKPDKEIYQYALERAGCRAEECVFIDDKEENVRAAVQAGIRGYQYISTDCIRSLYSDQYSCFPLSSLLPQT